MLLADIINYSKHSFLTDSFFNKKLIWLLLDGRIKLTFYFFLDNFYFISVFFFLVDHIIIFMIRKNRAYLFIF